MSDDDIDNGYELPSSVLCFLYAAISGRFTEDSTPQIELENIHKLRLKRCCRNWSFNLQIYFDTESCGRKVGQNMHWSIHLLYIYPKLSGPWIPGMGIGA
jgi:hypothetical protein